MAKFLKNEIFVSPKQTVQSIINIVEKFENGADRFDDITALCLDYSNKNNFMKAEASITIKNSIDQIPEFIEDILFVNT